MEKGFLKFPIQDKKEHDQGPEYDYYNSKLDGIDVVRIEDLVKEAVLKQESGENRNLNVEGEDKNPNQDN